MKKQLRIIINTCLLIGIISIALTGCTKPDNTADYVYTGGKIYTSNIEQPWAQAVAIDGTDIVYVGDNAGVEALIGKETVVTDLQGKMMMPGIISAHEHPLMLMGISAGLFMDNSGDKDIMMKTLEEYLQANPEGPYLSMGGAYEGTVEIYRQDIDRIIADQPFVMISASGHGGWANTKALEMAGILKDKPDPIDHFGRDKDGTPNGYLGSSPAAFYMVAKLDLIKEEAALLQADDVLGLLSSQGITAVYDAGVAPGMEESLFSVIGTLEKQNRLSVRIFGSAAMAQRPVHIEASIASLKKYGPMYSSEMFSLQTLKIHGDGDVGGMTAGLLEPYTAAPDHRGLVSFPDPQQLSSFMLDAAKLGFDIHTHTIGDWASRVTLDAYETVRKAGYTDVRLSTGHTMFVNELDRPRFKELDITVNTFATNIAVPNPEQCAVLLGKERCANYMPMKSFINNGVRLTLSADWPTEEINPFLQMYTAVTRSRVGEDAFLPPASEKLTLEDAVRAYTIDAAYQVRMEEILGSIEVGKRADLIIIDRNVFDIEVDQIPETNVLMTMMNGKKVYEVAVDAYDDKELMEKIEHFEMMDDDF